MLLYLWRWCGDFLGRPVSSVSNVYTTTTTTTAAATTTTTTTTTTTAAANTTTTINAATTTATATATALSRTDNQSHINECISFVGTDGMFQSPTSPHNQGMWAERGYVVMTHQVSTKIRFPPAELWKIRLVTDPTASNK
jgi:hypothetical protein